MLIELVTINPKFVMEYLKMNYEERMREYWGEHIFRTVVETSDFAVPSEENVGEIHRQIAQQRRDNLSQTKPISLCQNTSSPPTTSWEAFRIVQLSGPMGTTSGPAGKKLLEEIKSAGEHADLLKKL